MHDPDQDELDRLFARAPEPAPPADIGARARARLHAIRGARRLTLMALADAVALAALAVLAFLLGTAVARSEMPALLRLVLEDRALAMEARGELFQAFVSDVPWLYVLAVALDALALSTITNYLLRATAVVQAGGRPGVAP